jgi:hypothetical protein
MFTLLAPTGYSPHKKHITFELLPLQQKQDLSQRGSRTRTTSLPRSLYFAGLLTAHTTSLPRSLFRWGVATG